MCLPAECQCRHLLRELRPLQRGPLHGEADELQCCDLQEAGEPCVHLLCRGAPEADREEESGRVGLGRLHLPEVLCGVELLHHVAPEVGQQEIDGFHKAGVCHWGRLCVDHQPFGLAAPLVAHPFLVGREAARCLKLSGALLRGEHVVDAVPELLHHASQEEGSE